MLAKMAWVSVCRQHRGKNLKNIVSKTKTCSVEVFCLTDMISSQESLSVRSSLLHTVPALSLQTSSPSEHMFTKLTVFPNKR